MKQFITKQENINRAINRVQKTLLKLSTMAKTEAETLTTDQIKLIGNWNKYHDLENRLRDRLKDNFRDFQEWHWDKYGFNTYP